MSEQCVGNPGFWRSHWSRGEASTAEMFNALQPADTRALVEDAGFVLGDGAGENLNSLENRVFRYPIQGRGFGAVVLKLYRPGRWSRAAVEDEQALVMELEAAAFPSVRSACEGRVRTWRGIHHTFFEPFEGALDYAGPFTADEIRALGKQIAAFHQVSSAHPARDRPTHRALDMVVGSLDAISEWVVLPLRFVELSHAVGELAFELLGERRQIRTHADLSYGNMAWRAGLGMLFFDFDDMMMAPAELDLVLAAHGLELDGVGRDRDRAESLLFEGYGGCVPTELERLRLRAAFLGLRLVLFVAWIGARWHDPVFRAYFDAPWSDAAWARRVGHLEQHLRVLGT